MFVPLALSGRAGAKEVKGEHAVWSRALGKGDRACPCFVLASLG